MATHGIERHLDFDCDWCDTESHMEQLKQDIRKYIEDRKWSVLDNPASIAKSVSIEAAELLEIFQWKDYSKAEIENDPQILVKIREELADVFIYATEMAVSLDLNIEEIMTEKLQKNIKKYPAEAVRGNQEEYMKIKLANRGE